MPAVLEVTAEDIAPDAAAAARRQLQSLDPVEDLRHQFCGGGNAEISFHAATPDCPTQFTRRVCTCLVTGSPLSTFEVYLLTRPASDSRHAFVSSGTLQYIRRE